MAVIGNAKKTVLKELEFIVDSGSFNTVISPHLAKDLKIGPLAVEEVTLADGRKVKAKLSVAYIKLLDREGYFLVWIADSPEPLLGATVLEGLGLMVDPSTGKITYSRSFSLAAL